jgi:hypothetical protein
MIRKHNHRQQQTNKLPKPKPARILIKQLLQKPSSAGRKQQGVQFPLRQKNPQLYLDHQNRKRLPRVSLMIVSKVPTEDLTGAGGRNLRRPTNGRNQQHLTNGRNQQHLTNGRNQQHLTNGRNLLRPINGRNQLLPTSGRSLTGLIGLKPGSAPKTTVC